MGEALTVAAEEAGEVGINLLRGQMQAAGIEGAATMTEEELLAASLLLDAELIATV